MDSTIQVAPDLSMPTGRQLLRLAHDVFERICHIAVDLCNTIPDTAQRRKSRIRKLANELSIARRTIARLNTKSISIAHHDELQNKLRELVIYMEMLCRCDCLQGPGSLQTGQCPMLYTLLSLTTTQLPEFDPITEGIENKVRRNLLVFAGWSRDQRQMYLEKLVCFSGLARGDTLPYKEGWPREHDHTLSDLSRRNKSMLHRAFLRNLDCDCDKSHEVRLSLKGFVSRGRSHRAGNNTSFNEDVLMRSMSPVPSVWRDIQFRVTIGTGNATPLGQQSIPLNARTFCALVRSGHELNSRLRLEVRNSQFHQLQGVDPHMQMDLYPSHSLRDILQTHRLSNKDKLVLSYIIARSFWQYYDSQWMNRNWTSDSIHFFFKPPQNLERFPGSIYANDPYLAASFEEPLKTYDEFAGSIDVAYKYPRVLALCTILLEIVCGPQLERNSHDTIEQRFNDQFAQALRYAGDNSVWHSFEYKEFREALQTCLVSKTFDLATTRHGSEWAHDLEHRRKILHDNLVYPLHSLIRGLRFESELIRIEPLSLRGAGTERREASASREWMEAIYDAHLRTKALLDPLPTGETNTRSVRVAVLDTGCDTCAAFFQPFESARQIAKWRDFAGESSEPVDEEGHGTHCTSLVMKMAPEAEIYLARIAKRRDDIADAVEAICNAIAWASNEWDVDIITMSFGFNEHVREIRTSLIAAERMKKNQLLLFAAASNSGANLPEMFPACCDSVISIRQTDRYGAFSVENPPMNLRDAYVYGTLGRRVPSSWSLPETGEVAKSGCSVATAIAAGIATMILTHATLGFPSNDYPPPEVHGLWTRPGMLAMFERLSIEVEPPSRQRFLSPAEFYARNGNTAEAVRALLEEVSNSY
ncbi:hypothetical protein PFICI_11750 [Pestalotiopsis fici W106-1]|uniref:Uncharacterized protein n=1 Tax=Pestalotiopsis fici (strain W106-1 / CGMCC3.15140) TaxID=1229662 RepID=W3WR96_PESFW|nr:uncharacterized protein PFICI_11750 [Pestalotiopsis fici W106-1]ETS76363.1 hypothetical protein PFICI_11750 [Pestalotiopsis fici W106-1]